MTEQVASATARMEMKAADESGAAHLARAKEDLEERYQTSCPQAEND